MNKYKELIETLEDKVKGKELTSWIQGIALKHIRDTIEELKKGIYNEKHLNVCIEVLDLK